jgi:hypothetical protein
MRLRCCKRDRSAKLGGTLFHSPQPERHWLQAVCGAQAFSIIGDRKLDLIVCTLETDPDVIGLRMLSYIGQGFTEDAENRHLRVRVELERIAFYREGRCHSGAVREIGSLPLDRGYEPQVQYARTQIVTYARDRRGCLVN